MTELNRDKASYSYQTPETPYQRAQQAWDQRIGSATVQSKNWRVMAIGLGVVSLFLSVSLIILLTQSKREVYVAEVSQSGRVVNVAPLQHAYKPQKAQQEYFVAHFVKLISELPLDPVVAKQRWLEAYKFLNQRSAKQLTAFARKTQPLAMVGKKTITTTIEQVDALSENSFRVEWREQSVDQEGNPSGEKKMAGVFNTAIKAPTSEKDILQNPLGLIIKDFHFSERLA